MATHEISTALFKDLCAELLDALEELHMAVLTSPRGNRTLLALARAESALKQVRLLTGGPFTPGPLIPNGDGICEMEHR